MKNYDKMLQAEGWSKRNLPKVTTIKPAPSRVESDLRKFMKPSTGLSDMKKNMKNLTESPEHLVEFLPAAALLAAGETAVGAEAAAGIGAGAAAAAEGGTAAVGGVATGAAAGGAVAPEAGTAAASGSGAVGSASAGGSGEAPGILSGAPTAAGGSEAASLTQAPAPDAATAVTGTQPSTDQFTSSVIDSARDAAISKVQAKSDEANQSQISDTNTNTEN